MPLQASDKERNGYFQDWKLFWGGVFVRSRLSVSSWCDVAKRANAILEYINEEWQI